MIDRSRLGSEGFTLIVFITVVIALNWRMALGSIVLLPLVVLPVSKFGRKIRRSAEIATIAVGLILHPKQAEDILANGQADLVAIGREALFDPNWPLHAELALGTGGGEVFASWPKQYGWWLERREPGLRRLEGLPLPFREV